MIICRGKKILDPYLTPYKKLTQNVSLKCKYLKLQKLQTERKCRKNFLFKLCKYFLGDTNINEPQKNNYNKLVFTKI